MTSNKTVCLQAAAAGIREIKPDPILVVGANTPVGQWAILKIKERGFNVRIYTSNFEEAEKMFGADGSNVDIYFGSLEDLASMQLTLSQPMLLQSPRHQSPYLPHPPTKHTYPSPPHSPTPLHRNSARARPTRRAPAPAPGWPRQRPRRRARRPLRRRRPAALRSGLAPGPDLHGPDPAARGCRAPPGHPPRRLRKPAGRPRA